MKTIFGFGLMLVLAVLLNTTLLSPLVGFDRPATINRELIPAGPEPANNLGTVEALPSDLPKVESWSCDSTPHTSVAEGGRIDSSLARDMPAQSDTAAAVYELIRRRPPDTENLLRFIREPDTLPLIVNALIESGDVCKVRGHRWGWIMAEGNKVSIMTLEYRDPSVETRSCTVCGRTEYRSKTEWK